MEVLVFNTELVEDYAGLRKLLSRKDIELHSIATAGAAWNDADSMGVCHWVTVVYREKMS